MNKRLQQLIDKGAIPNKGGVFIDAYNQSVNEDVAGTITTRIDASNMSYVTEPKIIEPIACAMRGRNPDNPSERARSNGKYQQRIEMGTDISNTITSVQKDSLVAEPNPIIIDDYNQRIPKEQDVIGTVTTQFGNSAIRNGFKIAEPIIIDDTMGFDGEPRIYENYSPALRSERSGLNVAEPLRIPQATEKGYVEVPVGGVFDGSYPNSKTRRGRVQEGGQVSPTLMAGGEAPCYYEGIKKYKNEERRLFEEHNKTNSGKILCLLQQKVGKETYEWAIGRFRCILKEEILRCRMYEESICETREQKSIILSSSSFFKEDSISYSGKTDDVRDMWLHKEYRCTSQGYELSEQFSREFNDIVQKLSHENTSSEKLMSYLWRTCIMSIPLQQTLLEVEKIWESIGSKPQVSFRIRKLTEREVFRLMGVSETNIDKIQASGVSRSQQYKMAGNSIVVDVLEHIFRKMFVDTHQESQQLSLF